RQRGEGSSVRPGSESGAKARDGSPGNLGGPAHVHVQANRQIGSPVEQLTLARKTLQPSGSASCETRTRRIAWTPEAKQISDRRCVAGSRSTSIGPVTSGNRTHRDPIEGRGVPCGENR